MINECNSRRFAFVALAGSAVFAAGVDAQCLTDADGDGHPLFGSTFVRADFEFDGDGEFAGSEATHVSIGDVDGDGDQDLVFSATSEFPPGASLVSVALNRGDGVFDAPSFLEAPGEIVTTVLADFDGDGDLDIAGADAGEGVVAVYLNDGDGSFGAASSFPVGVRPRSLGAGDLDGDGVADLMVMNHGSKDVSVLLGVGDGSFGAETRVSVESSFSPLHFPPGNPEPGPHMALADVDGDGDLDGVFPCWHILRILVNDGVGGFTLGEDSPQVLGTEAFDIAPADLDGDGDVDLAVAAKEGAAQGLTVLFNEGGGAFAEPVAVGLETCASCFGAVASVSATDLEGDGDVDLVATDFSRAYMAVVRNEGGGTFAAAELRDADNWPWLVRTGDVSGDGFADVVVPSWGGQRSPAHVYLSDGEGTILGPDRSSETFPAPPGTKQHAIELGDLDGDGDLDSLVCIGFGAVVLRENVGAGQFENAGAFAMLPGPADATHAAAGDLNGDGLADLVALDRDKGDLSVPSRIFVAMQEGDFAFKQSQVLELEDLRCEYVRLGDLDGDGDMDAAIVGQELLDSEDSLAPVDRRLLVLLNDGEGALAIEDEVVYSVKRGFLAGGLAVGDLDSDGDLDAVAMSLGLPSGDEPVPSEVFVLLNDGEAGFEVSGGWGTPFGLAPVLGDIDGDGDLDLVQETHATPDGEYLRVMANDGAGGYSLLASYVDVEFNEPRHPVVGDLDGDGHLDVALISDLPALRVLLNDGDGGLGAVADYGVNQTPRGLAMGDVDLDGRADLAYISFNTSAMWVHRNVACEGCAADFNGDGSLDVLDFVALQAAFQAGDSSADVNGDGALNVLDFVAFQILFQGGCE